MKRSIAWVTALCLIVGMLGTGIGQETKEVYAADSTTIGDLSRNSLVDAEDLDLCREYIADASGVDSSVLALADVNNDGTDGSAKDLVRYKRYLMEPDTTWYTKAGAGATEYHITNAAELYGLAEVLETENETFEGKTVYVDEDITVNLGKQAAWNAEKELLKEWDSIGTDFCSWKGTFDGQNHTIEGLYQDTVDTETGLFAKTASSATVKNIRLGNSFFKTNTSNPDSTTAGSIVGNALGTIENVYSDATVEVVENVDGTQEKEAAIATTYFTEANISSNAKPYEVADTGNGLQLSGKTWSPHVMFELETEISGADVKTITVRFDGNTNNGAKLYFYSGSSSQFYVDLTGLNSPTQDAYISSRVDEVGFTILTLDFHKIPEDANNTWKIADRATKNITAVGLCCGKANGTPTFDYVAYNVKEQAVEDVSTFEFTNSPFYNGGYTISERTDDGIQISDKNWSYIQYNLDNAIDGAVVDTFTVRFQSTAVLYLTNNDSEIIYMDLSKITSATQGFVSRLTDDKGFTILTLDFDAIAANAGTNDKPWELSNRSEKDIKYIKICTYGGATPYFDYITFHTVHKNEGKGYGGIVGCANDATLKQCWFAGKVRSSFEYLGGIAGSLEGDSSISDCMMTGTVTSTMDSEQEKYVGGLVGICENANSGQSLTDCVMLGDVNVSWKDSDGAEISGARATGSVIGRNTTTLSFSDVYTTNDVTNSQAGGTVNITNANVPGCGDLSAEGTVSGAPKQRTLADIAQNVDGIISDLDSSVWQKAANNTPILSSFADLKDSKGADPSYLQKRSDGGIYFSNFDDAVVLERTEEVGINPWDNYIGNENATVTHGTLNNGDGSFTGLNVIITTEKTYSGVKYNLPETFSLGQAKTLGVRFTASGWHGGSISSLIYLTSGNTKVNITDYCNVYNSSNTSGTPTSVSGGHLGGVNYQTICLTVDVDTLLAKTDLTSIDGIILGHNSTTHAHVLDEFYYMPKYESAEFAKENTTTIGSNITVSDSANGDGIQVVGSRFQNPCAKYVFSSAISSADIDTMTIRYKPTGSSYVAVIYVDSGTSDGYADLSKSTAVVSRVPDGEFEILTFDFKKIFPNISSMTQILLSANNVAATVGYDYVEFAYAGDVEEVGLPTYEALENPDEDGLELAVYTGPTINTVEAYQAVKDAGVRSVYLNMWGSYALNNEHTLTALDSCGTVGLDAYIIPDSANKHGSETSSLVNFVDKATVDYTQYPAFKGIYAFDEPDVDQMDWIKTDMDQWENSNYKDSSYLVNLMRNDSSLDWSVENTKNYLNSYWDKVLKYNDENILMYDTYPLYASRKSTDVADNADVEGAEWTGTPFIRDFTLPVLETFANFAKEKRSTLYTFLQTYGNKYNDAGELWILKNVARNLKSVNDLRFQVAYNMAYGSKGFACFTYESQPQFGASMIYATGGKTNNYYYVQEVFNELKEWEHVYMAFDWQGTMTKAGSATGDGVCSGHLDALTQSLASHDRISSIETDYDLLVGTFKDANNNDGFLITSYTDPYYEIENTVKVTFNDASKAIIYKNGELQTNYNKKSCYVLEDGVLEMTLAAGDYLFVVPVQ